MLLYEKHPMDELFFYLHCRNFLLKGPSSNKLSTMYSVVEFIELSKVEELIQKQFYNTEKHKTKALLDKLSSRAVPGWRFKSIKMIDMNFALRIVLEFYVLEKRIYLASLRTVFSEMSRLSSFQSAEGGISMVYFAKLMELNFPHVSPVEICGMYRKAWSLGQGACTFDAFVAAANEEGWFVGNLKMESLHLTPDGSELLDRFTKRLSNVEAVRKKHTVYRDLYTDLQSDFDNMLNKHTSKILKISTILRSSFSPEIQRLAKELVGAVKEGLIEDERSTPVHMSDKLNYLCELASKLITFAKTTRAIDVCSSVDTDHGFRQAILSSRSLVTLLDSVFSTLTIFDFNFDTVLAQEAIKIQRVVRRKLQAEKEADNVDGETF